MGAGAMLHLIAIDLASLQAATEIIAAMERMAKGETPRGNA